MARKKGKKGLTAVRFDHIMGSVTDDDQVDTCSSEGFRTDIPGDGIHIVLTTWTPFWKMSGYNKEREREIKDLNRPEMSYETNDRLFI